MAVKQRYMIKHGWNVSQLKLKADPGEAFLVEEIKVATTDPTEFTKVTIDRVTVAYLSTFNIYTNQFWFSKDMATPVQLMRELWNRGVFKGYPIAEGQEMIVDITGSASPYVRMVYQVLEPGDIKADQENGSLAKEYLHFNYGTNSAQINDGASGKIDKCLTPVEFPDFPFGALVPPKTEIDILGILIGTYRKAVQFNQLLRWMKLVRGREVLFDEDRVGMYVSGGMLDYPFHAYGIGRWVELLPEPITFGPGDELTLEVSVGGGNLLADASLFCLIEKIRRLE